MTRYIIKMLINFKFFLKKKTFRKFIKLIQNILDSIKL